MTANFKATDTLVGAFFVILMLKNCNEIYMENSWKNRSEISHLNISGLKIGSLTNLISLFMSGISILPQPLFTIDKFMWPSQD